MIYLVFFLFCILFIEAFKRFKLLSHIREGSQSLTACVATLTDANVGDEKKEIMARNSSLAIGKHTLVFTLKAAAIIFILYFIAELTIRAGWLTSSQYEESLLSWQMLTILTVFSISYIKIRSHAFG